MLEASMIYSFKKGSKTHSLFVDSSRRRSEYWIETKARNGQTEASDKVDTWDEAVKLLESHEWTKYEMDKMNPLYFDTILAAKSRNEEKKKNKNKNYNAQQRLLEILGSLEKGETIKVEHAIKTFGVDKITIQRDVAALREYYQYSNREIPYIKDVNGYRLTIKGEYFSIDDALVVLLFLYGTRALNKEELITFSKKMINLFSLAEQIKLKGFFQSYLYHYKPVQEQNLFELFYSCFQAISEKKILTFTYTNNKKETSVKEVVPYTITYHDGKFYLLAALKGLVENGPRSWQMDRIQNLEITKLKSSEAPSDLTVAEYVQKAAYMYNGDPQIVRMRVAESNIEYLKRKFPGVSIHKTDVDGWYEAQLEVLGIMGIELWVMQQGPYVEVLEPLELRENVKRHVSEMHKMYYK